MKRQAEITRKTKETDIRIVLTLDGKGTGRINSGVPFLDHMLDLFAKHGLFDLTVKCKGDVHIDDHHTVEDIAICLGKAFTQALGADFDVRTREAWRLALQAVAAVMQEAATISGEVLPKPVERS